MNMVGASIFLLYTFLNEYYTDLEFLIDFMNTFLYSFFLNVRL